MFVPTVEVSAIMSDALAAVSLALVCDSETMVDVFWSINEASSNRAVAVLSRKSFTSAEILD